MQQRIVLAIVGLSVLAVAMIVLALSNRTPPSEEPATTRSAAKNGESTATAKAGEAPSQGSTKALPSESLPRASVEDLPMDPDRSSASAHGGRGSASTGTKAPRGDEADHGARLENSVPEGPATLERRAIDLAGRGAHAEAAEIYEQLARENPKRPAFALAAKLLRARASAGMN
jgi:hypothetical protein